MNINIIPVPITMWPFLLCIRGTIRSRIPMYKKSDMCAVICIVTETKLYYSVRSHFRAT